MAHTQLKRRQRADYGFTLEYRTRWSDNDVYSHLNNSTYYFLFDSAVNAYLIAHCGLDAAASPQIGLVVHSHCDYFRPASFPAVLDLCVAVRALGRSSVTYEVAVFERGAADVCAVGGFVHVFVGREDRRPAEAGMGVALKRGLERLLVGGDGKAAKL